ncbi:MAG: hypothetical protein DKT66_22065 [Candidatus Melainabacteria bacterium]|nr:MAG: hypothetical protein DKT66_22065 [Candidatus Melainabacteria bacterium]
MSVTCVLGGGGIKKKKARMKQATIKEKWNMYDPLVASGNSITYSGYICLRCMTRALSYASLAVYAKYARNSPIMTMDAGDPKCPCESEATNSRFGFI